MIRLIALLCLVCGSLHAQFEGVIESRNTTTDESNAPQQYEMTIWVKGAMARITTSATTSTPASTMIYRSDLRLIWMLNEESKSYYQVSMGKSQEEPPGNEEPATVRRTGKSKKILGYACDQYLITQGDMETEIWGTKALRDLSTSLARALGEEHAGQGEAWNDELTRLGVYPLVANSRIEGNVAEAQEVVKIDRRSLPDDLFALPAGFKKQSVGDILK